MPHGDPVFLRSVPPVPNGFAALSRWLPDLDRCACAAAPHSPETNGGDGGPVGVHRTIRPAEPVPTITWPYTRYSLYGECGRCEKGTRPTAVSP